MEQQQHLYWAEWVPLAQYVQTVRDPSLYTDTVDRKDASLAASALFAYKLNWQTVLFVGYGDNRTFLEETDRLEHEDQDRLEPPDREPTWVSDPLLELPQQCSGGGCEVGSRVTCWPLMSMVADRAVRRVWTSFLMLMPDRFWR